MANSQGVAYVFGSPAIITLYTAADSTTTIFAGTTSTANEGFDLSHECDTEEVKNTSGEVVGHIVSNNRLTLIHRLARPKRAEHGVVETLGPLDVV